LFSETSSIVAQVTLNSVFIGTKSARVISVFWSEQILALPQSLRPKSDAATVSWREMNGERHVTTTRRISGAVPFSTTSCAQTTGIVRKDELR